MNGHLADLGAAVADDGAIRIRRLRETPAEYELLTRWLNEPHVRHWWDPDHPPATPAWTAEHYPARFRDDDPTYNCFIELDDKPVGFIQFYRWQSYPDDVALIEVTVDDHAWGLDVLIGEPDMVNRGVGSGAVDLLCRHLIEHEAASAILLVTDIENLRAHRAYEKVGFVKIHEILDTDTRDGERVRSYVMRRLP